ncbi:MAG: glycosyltransferase family 2 protein [Candidatus Omnitrophica bacterium]|nr:glycosyltransferase family 2 protein [Candidatus Omnitrophota bacterium]
MKTCVLIPAYNEAQHIGGVIQDVRKYIPDIVVINDGSADDTEKIARENGANVISLKQNKGKGEVLKLGFDYAVANNYDAVITMDGDGQHSPGDILNLTETASRPRVGVVVGNRMCNPEGMPPVRFAINLLMSFIISLICRQNVPDTQCGYRLIKVDVLRKVRLTSSKYEIESEMIIKASRLGFKVASAPVKSVYAGQVSLINPVIDTWRFFIMLCRVLI